MNSVQEKSTKIIFRFLSSSEYHKLEPIYLQHNDSLPNPNISSICVAELEDGTIIGFCTIQLSPMITMWIDEAYRGKGIWIGLVEDLPTLPIIQQSRTYVVCTKDETIEMCKRLGLRLINHPVYVRDVE